MQQFLEFLAASGLAIRSCDVYGRAVARCQAMAEASDVPLVEVSQLMLRDPVLTGARRMTYRKALLKWAAWSKDKELEAVLRAVHIRGEKTRKSQPYALSREDYLRFLEVVDEEVADPAEWGAIILIATTGMRVGDVLGIPRASLVEALRPGAGTVWVRQKGGKQRELSLSSVSQVQAAGFIIAALNRPQARVWRADGLRRKAANADSVAGRLRRRIADLGKSAGLNVRVTPQILRKSLADIVYEESGNDLRLVAQVLGHDSVKTTQEHYQNHGRPEKLREIMGRIQR